MIQIKKIKILQIVIKQSFIEQHSILTQNEPTCSRQTK